ncbi:phage terminase small subunit [Planomicrobium soli]|uniref:Phage terminase small subunit n=1 Tax=Planomicrobium soli TaxID=1176648 RepID=A0A2P8H7E0_9BACL|nr:terminase small subunit [Planomicrobium soli]PSL42138.1 phage terminase small subunit [Planomicrobium soli]
MVNLTEKQLRFADEYVRTGNISESYRNAYPNVKKDAAARASGSRLLTNVNVKSYIQERMELLKKDSIAEQDEILQFLTSVVRGKASGTALVGLGMGEQSVDQVPPTIAERTKAAELLGKRYALFTDKQEIDVKGAVKFIDDIGGGENGS